MNGYLKYLINDCYEEDYDPYCAETWRDNYCYEYTFVKWYFLYRKYKIKYKDKHYKHTPAKLIIGNEVLIMRLNKNV
jgi:hypothetical protein